MPNLSFQIFRARHGCIAAVLLLAVLSGCGDKPEKLVASGRDNFLKQDYKAAIVQLKNALQAKPDHAEARYLLGVALLKVNDPVSAEKELRRASELNYSAEKTGPALAEALLAEGKVNAVVIEFGNTTLSSSDAQAALQTHVGNAYLRLGKTKEAEEFFDKALKAQPEYAPAKVGQARLTALKRDLPRAESIVAQVLTTSPKQVEALTLKAALARAQNRPDEAIAGYQQAVAQEPNSVEAHSTLGLFLVERGKLEEAKKEADAMAKIAPQDARTIYLRALIAFQERKYVEARDLGLLIRRSIPDSPGATRITGASHFFLGNDLQAQADLSAAVRRAPSDLYARRLLVASYLRSGDTAVAKRVLREGLTSTPKDPGLLALQGEAAIAERNLEGAAAAYEHAMVEAPSNGSIAARLGQLHLATGDTAEGLKILEDASLANGDRIQADVLLVTYHLRKGQVDKAIAGIDAIEKKRPSDALGPSLRGVAQLASQDSTGARASFEKALQLQPGYVPALAYLARLDVEAKNAAAADSRFQAAIQKAPGDEQLALAYVSFLRSQKAAAQKTADVLTRLVQAEPRSVRGRFALVAILLETGDSARAVSVAQEGLAADPENTALLSAAGQALLSAGDTNQALAMFTKLTSLQPHSPQPHVLIAAAYLKDNSELKALDALRQALKIQPDYLPAQLSAARLEARAGRIDAAVKIARDVQKQRPKAAVGYLMEAQLLMWSKRWAEAERVLAVGLKNAPVPAMAIRQYAVLVEGSEESRAAAFADKWIGEHPKDADFRAYLGERAMARGRLEEASKHFKAALEIAPNSVVVLNNLGWVGGQLKDPNALGYAERANELAPNTPVVLDTLGWLLVERGQVPRGVEVLRKAVQLAPEADVIRLNLAKALLRAGDKQAARSELDLLAKKNAPTQVQSEVQDLLKTL